MLFSEFQGCYVVTIPAAGSEKFNAFLQNARVGDIPPMWLGRVTGNALVFEADEHLPEVLVSLSALHEANERFFKDWMAE